MKTLVVEDSFVNRKALTKLLTPFGPCDAAVNGREAVEAFKAAHAQGVPYDIIFLDITMPEMDGQTTLQHIREHEAGLDIGGRDMVNVIMTTALNSRQHIMGAFRTGCEAYLIKPITREKLYRQLLEMNLLSSEQATAAAPAGQ